MKRWGIRWQLTAWYTLALGLLLVAFSLAIYVTIRTHLLQRINSELAEESRELIEELQITVSEEDFSRRFAHRYAPEAIYGFLVARMDGSVLFGSPWMQQLALPRPTFTNDLGFETRTDLALSNGRLIRLIGRAVETPEQPLLAYAAVPLNETERQLRTLLWWLCVMGMLGLVAAVFIGYLIAGTVLAPLRRITATAEQISSDKLSERVPVLNERDELGRLAVTLNTMFDRLEGPIQEMRRFTADAAHELRTPLTLIRTEIEVTLRENAAVSPPISPAFRRVSEVVLSETTRLSRLVDQLLALSRRDAGLDHVTFEPVSVRELALDVVETLQTVADQKRLTIQTMDLTDQQVVGDDVALSQVLFNLLDNAIKYTSAGGTISLACDRLDEFVRIIVRDTGCGIAAEHLPHLFERFYRVDVARSGTGTGLGLAICRSIVTSHQGRIDVDSQPGVGTTFTVFLPVRH